MIYPPPNDEVTPFLTASGQPKDTSHSVQHLSRRQPRSDARRLKILLAEDNDVDVWLFREAFQALGLPHQLEIAPDGEQALARLRTRPLPDLILLDLNMPKLDGFEVLSAIRADPKLCLIPVIILSSSRDPKDVRRAQQLGANSYLCKSTEDFSDLVGDFDRYWLRRAELPDLS